MGETSKNLGKLNSAGEISSGASAAPRTGLRPTLARPAGDLADRQSTSYPSKQLHPRLASVSATRASVCYARVSQNLGMVVPAARPTPHDYCVSRSSWTQAYRNSQFPSRIIDAISMNHLRRSSSRDRSSRRVKYGRGPLRSKAVPSTFHAGGPGRCPDASRCWRAEGGLELDSGRLPTRDVATPLLPALR